MTEEIYLSREQQKESEASFSPAEKIENWWRIFRMLPSQVRALCQVVTSYPDYLLQLFLLFRDPIYRSSDAQQGVGQPILLIHGFLVGDWTLWVMAGWLRRMGYRPYLSGIDWNIYTPERTGERLAQRIVYIVKETNSPVIMVGHSLGGMLARSLGAYFPPDALSKVVRHVVAIGSPIHNSSSTSHLFLHLAFLALQSFGRTIGKAPLDLSSFVEKVSAPLPAKVGFTAIFSTRDELVDWRSCVDPQGNNYPVSGRHLGLVANQEVYRILAHILRAL
jgi:pimeloyl-ACP methyl ester carboxylesterase